jgi:hypothetical protein
LFFCISGQLNKILATDTLVVQDTTSIPVLSRDSIGSVKSEPRDFKGRAALYGHMDTLHAMPDSLMHKKTKIEKIPTPQRATVLSAVLPGLGQAYVGKYWKIPIIYGIGYGLFYYYNEYNTQFQKFRLAFEESGDTKDEAYRDLYGRKKNYCVIGVGILYLVNIVDAMVDAYFKTYDISRDLSVRISPRIITQPAVVNARLPVNYGVLLRFNIK